MGVHPRLAGTLRRLRTDNPCRDVKKLRELRRKRLMTHDEQVRIGAATIEGKNGWKNANGAMYAALFDFAYLSAVRARDARSLKWIDVGDAEIWLNRRRRAIPAARRSRSSSRRTSERYLTGLSRWARSKACSFSTR